MCDEELTMTYHPRVVPASVRITNSRNNSDPKCEFRFLFEHFYWLDAHTPPIRRTGSASRQVVLPLFFTAQLA